LTQFVSPDDEDDVFKICRVENKNKYIEKNCASRWSFTKNHYMKHGQQNIKNTFLILNFHHVLNIVCILLGIFPASDCDLPTFRNLELTEGSETSANHNLTPGKYPKEYIQ
jgi:hypothetical protein